MEFKVTAYVNVHRDSFFGYEAGHPVAEVCTFRIKATSTLHALDGAYGGLWAIGNRMACDLGGTEWPSDVRSLSMGDVAKVVTLGGITQGLVTWHAAAGVGWVEITEPTHIVPIEGTKATSRRKADADDEDDDCDGSCIERPHRFTYGSEGQFRSPRCQRSGCDVMGTGDPCGDGECEGTD